MKDIVTKERVKWERKQETKKDLALIEKTKELIKRGKQSILTWERQKVEEIK